MNEVLLVGRVMMMERPPVCGTLLTSSSSLFVVERVVVSVGVVYIHIHAFKLVPLSNQWPSSLPLWFVDDV